MIMIKKTQMLYYCRFNHPLKGKKIIFKIKNKQLLSFKDDLSPFSFLKKKRSCFQFKIIDNH